MSFAPHWKEDADRVTSDGRVLTSPRLACDHRGCPGAPKVWLVRGPDGEGWLCGPHARGFAAGEIARPTPAAGDART